ncbi:hypothetical protein V8F20_010004 [Naviculisporaceae sp. PSN 640]
MLLKPFSVAALVAASAAANAFLLPPHESEFDLEVAGLVPVVADPSEKISVRPAFGGLPEVITVKLDCPGCVVPGYDVDSPPKNHLQFMFLIEQNYRFEDRLTVNGYELFPSTVSGDGLYAFQIVDDEPKADEHFWKLGYSLGGQGPVSRDGNFELWLLNLQILEVGSNWIKGIETIQIKLLKAVDGNKLKIASVELLESENPAEIEQGEAGEECTTMMCKWIAYAQDKMKKMKEHMKAKPCHGNGMGKGWGMGHGHHGGPGPAHHGHHGSFGHGHGHGNENPQRPPHFDESNGPHSVGKLFKNIASHILLPVLIGVVAGVSVSLIGMVIGTLVVSTWRALSGRRAGAAYAAVATKEDQEEDAEDLAGDEKSGLMEHQGPPPAYDEDEQKQFIV